MKPSQCSRMRACVVAVSAGLWPIALYGQKAIELKGHTAGVHSVAFAPAATGEKDKRPGAPQKVFRGHMLPVLSVAFSKDEKSVFSASLFGFVNRWSLAEGKPKTTLGTGWTCNAACLSRDGRLLAIACNNTTDIRIWRTTGSKPGKIAKPEHILKGHAEEVRVLAFSPDGSRVASGSEDGVVKIWDTQTGKQLHSTQAHKSWVLSIALSTDGKVVASGDEKGIVVLSQPGKPSREIMLAHSKTSVISALAFSPDGKSLAACTSELGNAPNSELRIWRVSTRKEVRRVKLSKITYVAKLAFSPNSEILAASAVTRTVKKEGKNVLISRDLGEIQLRDVKTGKLMNTLLPNHSDPFTRIVFSADGKKLVAGCGDCGVYMWNLKGRK